MIGDRSRAFGQGGTILPVMPTRFALFELGIFVAIVLGELLLNSFPDLTRMNPHPYWIAVLLLSLQYGTVSGLLAAVIAIAGSVMIGMAEPDIGESYFSYLVRVWTQPVLWLVVALLLGSFRMRQIELRDDLEREVGELRGRGLALVDHSNNLKTRCEALERQLAAKAKPETDRLLEALAGLHQPDSSAWVGAVEQAFDIMVPGAQASIFIADGDGLKLLHKHRWPDTARWRRDVAGSEPLAHAVLGEARPLSIMSAADEAVLAGEGLFAVPIISPVSSAVVGLLKIETMGPQAIDAGLIDRLQAMAIHVAPTLKARLPLSLMPRPVQSRDLARDAARDPAKAVSAAGGGKVARFKLWSLFGGKAAPVTAGQDRDSGASLELVPPVRQTTRRS